jgi:hypothetical protein
MAPAEWLACVSHHAVVVSPPCDVCTQLLEEGQTPDQMGGYCMKDFGLDHCQIHSKGHTNAHLQRMREL